MSAVQSHRTAQPTFHLIARLDDLVAAGRESEKNELSSVLDVLRGEVGISGLSVWAAAAPATYLRAREAKGRFECSEGGLYFDPPAKAGGCRPPTAGTGSFLALSSVARACEHQGLALRLRFATATLGGLARYYPEFASRNLFDDASRHSVCLLNPAVQECIAGIVTALPPQLGRGAVVLDDFKIAWFEALDTRTRWPSPPGNAERTLLSLCFCQACAKTAQELGVDAEEARARAKSYAQRFFARGVPFGGTLDGFLAEQPALAAYANAQSQSLGSLLKKIVEDSDREILVCRGTSSGFDDFDAQIPAGVVITLSQLADLAAPTLPASRRTEIALPASALLGPASEEFVAAMSRLPELQVAGVEINDFAVLPDSALTTLKQGIRFARRVAQS